MNSEIINVKSSRYSIRAATITYHFTLELSNICICSSTDLHSSVAKIEVGTTAK